MSKESTKIDIDLTIMAIALITMFFYGEPSLKDAIVYYLMNQC